MDNNPLADREKALENQYIKEKEKQMAKAKAAQQKTNSDGQSQAQQPAQGKQ
ncbi:hypothetical protein F5Y15DRAFT_413294 [Xylariaceae sp. FL0016]|nr:hypothetical protein F5Y15DRAFT_413294 [Xylariaceae sp. FL0016]